MEPTPTTPTILKDLAQRGHEPGYWTHERIDAFFDHLDRHYPVQTAPSTPSSVPAAKPTS